MTVSEIAGQKITTRPASRPSAPAAVIAPRASPGPALPATTRSTIPCMTQTRPAISESSTTVAGLCPRQ